MTLDPHSFALGIYIGANAIVTVWFLIDHKDERLDLVNVCALFFLFIAGLPLIVFACCYVLYRWAFHGDRL